MTGQLSHPSPHASGHAPGHVICIGHAIVDVLCANDDAFLGEHQLVKGSMELVDQVRAEPLYAAMRRSIDASGGDLLQISGGSGANTAVVSAALGASTGFVGKVHDDELGEVFAHDLRAAGVHYATSTSHLGIPTGRCLINVTPDAERTMCTFLGAARGIREADISPEWFSTAEVTYLEGYLWDEPNARAALELSMRMVHAAGRRFSLTLSDPFLVDRFRDEFHQLLGERAIDVLFANEHELCSLYRTDDLKLAMSRVQQVCPVAAITRGAAGAVVVSDDGFEEVDAAPVERVLDTTGAGDAFAGGFLFGLTDGRTLGECGWLGNQAAADVISHLGARPSVGLRDRIA